MSAGDEFVYAPISELAPRLQRKEISPVEVVNAVLDRIDVVDEVVGAFYTLFRDAALAAARDAEKEIQRGEYRGPLHGIPVGIKDIFECGATTCGSETLAKYVAEQDCAAVKKLREAGALILGKTATYEFAFGYATKQSYFPPTHNPWSFNHDAGGSSSGSAAAVAAGMAYGALGTCTGGSIRWPAQCCGIVGLKATYGRVSRAGVYPLSWSLDHVGPLARSVTDAALLLQGCAGYDADDPASANVPLPDFTEKLGRDIKGLRIGLLSSIYQDNCDGKILAPYSEALKVFESLGAELVEVPSISLDELLAIEWPTLFAECASIHVDNVRNRGDSYNPHTKLLVAYGLLVSGAQYLMGTRARAQVRNELLQLLTTEVDVLMLPTAGVQVGPIPEESPGIGLVTEGLSIYTPIFNFTGLPAIQIPCGFDSDGLPVGLQIAGKPFDEPFVLQVARAYEQATPWHERHPKL
jgi:aspartyl-tRNA(Asn)/glutamyl-tRNA(Gln) amidotransferase subunit A